MAELMPITRPARSTSGPPELPGLMAASVWMKSATAYCVPSSSLSELRSLADTMPLVTVERRPSGLPMATTGWPTCTWRSSPSVAVGSPVASILMSATSVVGSRPMTRARKMRRS
jgi:hypothetical protein